MSGTANIFNIQHFSVNDGPGIRTVVFFKGCPLNCVWCHNPESKSTNPELSFLKSKCVSCRKCAEICTDKVHSFENGVHCIDRSKCVFCGKCVDICAPSALEIIGKKYTVDDIMTELAKDDVFFAAGGGVTFSGGEPFMQFDALYSLLKACKEKGYSACIETSGFTTTDNILKAAEYTDYFLFDCKETNPANHKKYIGADNKLISENLSALCSVNAHVILRCPIVPGINDRQEHFNAIAKLANKYSCIKSIEFMPYHPLGISKSEQLGKTYSFDMRSFADKKMIENHCHSITGRIFVPIKIN